ncbi:hypothetical protein [Paenibacillus sp. ACRRY]|uniref:hypothetical protein n=1 Tax=Paenibacillus sp. ACRRY TaxID=2918208 RepID=UPI001EF6E57F|nr:hypothetical protein [Paenibacillus sp. ACRRY]MCG7381730.1 hypothetical protein [Paenibacillus sp. ACRRY]
MKYFQFWRKYRDWLILLGIMIVFVGGIFGIGSIFSIGNLKPRTVVLPSEQFESRLAPPPSSTIHTESATKIPNDFAIYDFEVVNRNTIIMNQPDSSYTGIQLSVMQLDDNKVKKIAGSTDYGVVISPDHKKMIYSQHRAGHTQSSTYEYDIQTGGRRKLLNDNSYYKVFAGNDSYIGQDELLAKQVNLTTNESRVIYTHDELMGILTGATQSLSDNLIFMDDLEISEDLKSVYLLVLLKDKYTIYRVSLEGDLEVKKYAALDEIQQFKLLKNGDMLILGTMNNVQGLFRYHPVNDSYDVIVEGSIWSFDLNADESRIAYFLMKDSQNQNNEMHIAYLNDDKLSSDTVIYRNIDNFIKLKWNEDELFFVGGSLTKSELYRFTFRVW